MASIAGKQVPKWAVMVGVFLVAGFSLGGISRCTESKITSDRAKNEVAPAEASDEKLPAHEVVKVEDISAGETPRFQYRVAVEGQPSPEQLQAVADEVFETAKGGRDFSALSVGFFDYPEFAEGQYTLGVVEYAPEGDWAKASSIEPGDYDALQAKADLPTKDWSKQLTADEVAVWAAWWAEYRTQADAVGSDPSKAVDEDAVTDKVAKETGTAADEVKAILTKQMAWANQ